MKKTHLSTFNEGGYAEYRIPGIVCTNKNTLLAYCEARSGGTDWGKIEIALWRGEPAPTEDDPAARSWSDKSILVPSVSGETVNNANMIVDGDLIGFIYHVNYRRAFYMESTDDGRSWSEPREITQAFDEFRDRVEWNVCASGPSHGTRLSNGRLIMPCWIGGTPEDPYAHWPNRAGVIYSDDHGENWHAGGLILDDRLPNNNESVIAELSDGKVMINMRSDLPEGLRTVAVSSDGGETFSEFRTEPQLRDPGCSAGMATYKGKIYFTNCDNAPSEEDSRINLKLKVSGDDGRTWEEAAYIEERAGYSDVCVDRNGNVYCFYECERPEVHNGSFPQLHLTVAECLTAE